MPHRSARSTPLDRWLVRSALVTRATLYAPANRLPPTLLPADCRLGLPPGLGAPALLYIAASAPDSDLEKGSVLLLDTAVMAIEAEGVYLLSLDRTLRLRRAAPCAATGGVMLWAHADGRWQQAARRRKRPPILIPPTQASRLEVLASVAQITRPAD
jgi:hypothetical protein